MTYVRGEIGTSGVFGDVEFDLTNATSIRDAIAYAVGEEHNCDQNHCDICLALEFGYPYVAAHLLQGATETPFLDAVMYIAKSNEDDFVPEWDEWVLEFRETTKECSCGSFVRREYDHCDNCGAGFWPSKGD